MHWVGWLLGAKPDEEPKKKDVPSTLVVTGGELRGQVTENEANRYEYVPAAGALATTYSANAGFYVNGLVDAFGIILPYFEVTVGLATAKTEMWVGFLNVGGAELVHKGRPAHFGYDIFAEFDVGDVIGIGINGKTRHLYIAKNGELLRGELVPVKPDSVKEVPAVRLGGGPCKFHVNFGEEAFAYSPYSYNARTSKAEPVLEKKPEKKKKQDKGGATPRNEM
jgi:hypothetical protein